MGGQWVPLKFANYNMMGLQINRILIGLRNMKYLILPDIRSAHNVGAMFRTADGAGVSKVFLAGHSPCPIDRFGRPQAEIQKTSLGASDMIDWEYVENVPQLLVDLRQRGVTVVAVEQGEKSIPLADFTVPQAVAYVMGNEVDGVPEHIQALCDVVVELPMLGQKESLNVATTAGIVLYHQLSG
jgi:tRNA G18 (ribose-2'-O)-methylase SpoU